MHVTTILTNRINYFYLKRATYYYRILSFRISEPQRKVLDILQGYCSRLIHLSMLGTRYIHYEPNFDQPNPKVIVNIP